MGTGGRAERNDTNILTLLLVNLAKRKTYSSYMNSGEMSVVIKCTASSGTVVYTYNW